MAKSFDTQERPVGDGEYMQSQVTLNDDGNFQVVTHTFTHVALKGFTGGVMVTFSDAQGNIIMRWGPVSYGVDGTAIPFGSASDRTVTETGSMSSSQAQTVDRIDAVLAYMPNIRFWTDLGAAPAAIQKIIDFIEWLINALQSAGGSPTQVNQTTSDGEQELQEGAGNLWAGTSTGNVWLGHVSRLFHTAQPPSPPPLPTPTGLSEVVGALRTVTFKWSRVANATGYSVEVQRGTTHVETKTGHEYTTYAAVPSGMVPGTSGTSRTFTAPTGFALGRWRVTAGDSTGHHSPSAATAWRAFEIP